jgi:integrase
VSVDDYYTKGGKRRWRARVFNPHTKKVEHVGVFDTKKDAKTAENRALAKLTPLTIEQITVNRWRKLWLETHPVGESTKLWHEERSRRFAEEYGEKLLVEIGRPLALEWHARHPSTTQVLSAMWTAAIDKDLAEAQPWRGLTARGPGRKLMPGWLVEQDVADLTNAALEVHQGLYGIVARAMILTGAYVGLRPGELAGLQWPDVRFDVGRIHVEHQANAKLRRLTLPKHDHTRVSVMPPVVADALMSLPRLHPELVFPTPRGAIHWPSARDRLWHPIRSAVGRHRMVMHELRHYAATWLLEHGVSDSDVADQLGHQDGGVQVRRTYDHHRVEPALERVAAALNAVPTLELPAAAGA